MAARMTAWVAIALALASGPEAANATPPPVPAAADSASWPPPGTRVAWERAGPRPTHSVALKLLAFNDFHGNLEAPIRPGIRAAGGAAVLAAYLQAAARGYPGRTLLLHAGDIVGASPPISRLLRDEPSMDFLNLLAGPGCRFGMATQFFDAASARTRPDRCNMVGTLGNHEFDRGPQEILRLLDGGTAADGPFLDRVYRGVRIPYVCANVFDRRTGRTLLPPYAVVSVGGVPVGVIGAVVRDTPHLVQAWAVADLEFRDEADAINAAAAELTAHGIHAIVVIIHQGVIPAPADEPGAARDADGNAWHGLLAGIVARLDPAVDVVVSGHTHSYTNALLPDVTGAPVLVTQAYSYGLAYADIDLGIDRRTGGVFAKSALIVPTWADAGPGRRPDPRVLALTRAAAAAIAPRIARVVGEAAEAITRRSDGSGESALGDLVADAERAATQAEIALVNAGGMRADLDRGPVTWGEILTLHPFGNRLVTMELTGAQIRAVLEEQWREDPASIPQILKISGLSYLWDPAQPPGHRIVVACDAARQPLDPARTYRVTTNDFLAAGGDGFQTFRGAPAGVPGPTDAEALSSYIEASQGPVDRHIEGRIARADRAAGALCPAPPAQP